MRDYFTIAALPMGTNKMINGWREKNDCLNHYMSLYLLKSRATEEAEGVLSRFVIFSSTNEEMADKIEVQFQMWVDEFHSEHFECTLVKRDQSTLPEDTLSSILMWRRTRLLESTKVLELFATSDNDKLQKHLLQSVWQVICTRTQRLDHFTYFTRNHLVPSVYLPPDSTVGMEDLSQSVSAAVRTISYHRDRVYDRYIVFARTSYYLPNEKYIMVADREVIPMNEVTFTDQVVKKLSEYWHLNKTDDFRRHD